MTINSTNLSYAIDDTVAEYMFEGFFESEIMWPLLAREIQTTRPDVNVASFDTVGMFDEKAELANIAPDEYGQQFKTTFVAKTYAKQIVISDEAYNDARFDLLGEAALQLGRMAAETIEYRTFALLVNAFAGGAYLAEDGLSICNTAHLNAAGGNSQGNYGTTALAESALGATRLLGRKITDYTGTTRVGVLYDELWVPVDLEDTAVKLVRSAQVPQSNNNDVNPYVGTTLRVSRMLTDTNAWFFIDSRLRSRYVRMYNRQGLSLVSTGIWSNLSRAAAASMRFSVGCTDWRWVYGHNPS